MTTPTKDKTLREAWVGDILRRGKQGILHPAVDPELRAMATRIDRLQGELDNLRLEMDVYQKRLQDKGKSKTSDIDWFASGVLKPKR